jgi:hypothetical protein
VQGARGSGEAVPVGFAARPLVDLPRLRSGRLPDDEAVAIARSERPD